MRYASVALPDLAIHEFDLFVVHAAADTDFVRGYLLPAINLPSSRVLLVDELTPGVPVVSEIDRAVSRSRFTVVVLSPAYFEDRWAAFGEQLASYASMHDARVVPLRLADCQLPLRLEARVALDFTDRTRWEEQVARLRTLLHTTAPAAEPLPCPYPGMRAFAASEASRFFGREEEVADLIGRLDRDEREIYVIGPSGSGKSSLVHAGLLHALDSGASRLERSFVVRAMRPGERPADRLAKALEGDLTTPSETIEATIDALVARHPPAARVLVFVDQLEELFTCASSVEQQRFIAALCALRGEPRCYLVLALRADFYGALLDSELWPDFAGRISTLAVAPLRGPALAQAITAPALRIGVHLEPRLCDRLVADAAAEPGALPLVQEMLRLLWDMRRHRFLGLAEYEALGDGGRGLDVAIARRADTTIRMLTADQQTIARRVLLRLVSFGEGRADTRRQQEVRALRAATDDEAEFARVLHRLIDGRLVTVDGDDRSDARSDDRSDERSDARSDAVLADLSHEALITGWPTLRGWIAGSREDEQRRRQLELKVGEWIERGRGTVSLLDAVELAEAVHWMQSDAARELGYGPELPALIAASRDELEKVERQARQARRFVGATYLEQGRALLISGRPMQALPYLVAARAEAVDSPVLRMLFAQAASNLPLVTFVGHGSSIRHAAFSPDGTRVVTASWDNTARVWDATTGAPVTPPLEHRCFVVAAAFSPDGACVVTASADRTARVWNASTGAPVTPPLEHRAMVHAAAFSADGARVVTASADKAARIWDVAMGKPVGPALEHQGAVYTAAFSPDGARVVTASHDNTARVWDASTGAPMTGPLEHRDVVHAAAFSADGTRVVTASYDRTARVWDAATGQVVTPPLEHRGDILGAAFSPDGARVVTASLDKTARIWDSSTGEPVVPPLMHHGVVCSAVFSPDGRRVVTASDDKTARVWDATTGAPVTPPLEHQRLVWTAAFGPDGRRVVTASADKTARVWDAMTGRPTPLPLEHRDAVHAAAFSPDGTRVITASADQTARIWDPGTGMSVTSPLEHRGLIHTAAFSPDGRRVVTASADQTARIWDATTGQPVTPPLEHRGAVCAVAFGPDGARVVTASDDRTARIWDASTGVPLTPPLVHQDQVCAAAFGPDGARVVTASFDTTARLWDAMTGRPAAPPLEHQDAVCAVAFSPDGTRVVTASRDRTARVWDAATGKQVTPPLEHQCIVHAAVFSADGTRVVTASRDGTAQVWDAATGKPVTPPLEHRDAVCAAAFSLDGTRVVTASRDRTARVWTFPADMGSLEDWRLLARCSPFALVDQILMTNPEPMPSMSAVLRPSFGGERKRQPAARRRSGIIDLRRIASEQREGDDGSGRDQEALYRVAGSRWS